LYFQISSSSSKHKGPKGRKLPKLIFGSDQPWHFTPSGYLLNNFMNPFMVRLETRDFPTCKDAPSSARVCSGAGNVIVNGAYILFPMQRCYSLSNSFQISASNCLCGPSERRIVA
jgi:hypothetical protein